MVKLICFIYNRDFLEVVETFITPGDMINCLLELRRTYEAFMTSFNTTKVERLSVDGTIMGTIEEVGTIVGLWCKCTDIFIGD